MWLIETEPVGGGGGGGGGAVIISFFWLWAVSNFLKKMVDKRKYPKETVSVRYFFRLSDKDFSCKDFHNHPNHPGRPLLTRLSQKHKQHHDDIHNNDKEHQKNLHLLITSYYTIHSLPHPS